MSIGSPIWIGGMKNIAILVIILGSLVWSVIASYFLYEGIANEEVIRVFEIPSYCSLQESPAEYWFNIIIVSISTFGSIFVSIFFFLTWRKNQLSKNLAEKT